MNEKWMIALIAVSLSIVANWVVVYLFIDNFYKLHFGGLRFIYYLFPVCFLSFALSAPSLRLTRWRRFIATASLFAYFGSVIAYFSLVLLWRFPWSHPEVLLVMFILPMHIFFVVAAIIASVAMRLLFPHMYAGRISDPS